MRSSAEQCCEPAQSADQGDAEAVGATANVVPGSAEMTSVQVLGRASSGTLCIGRQLRCMRGPPQVHTCFVPSPGEESAVRGGV